MPTMASSEPASPDHENYSDHEKHPSPSRSLDNVQDTKIDCRGRRTKRDLGCYKGRTKQRDTMGIWPEALALDDTVVLHLLSCAAGHLYHCHSESPSYFY
jgi:hypothetical protein